jgi:HEPN domain-containing protein
VPGPDPEHWLHRLTAAEWLAAAETELAHAEAALTRRAARPGVTHARRAAGMAWNAVLVKNPDGRAGRSYMEHVVALAADTTTPIEVRQAAQRLRDTPPMPPALVPLGRPDLAAADAARTILNYARSSQ